MPHRSPGSPRKSAKSFLSGKPIRYYRPRGSADIKELIDEGWLSEEGAAATGGPGRRPTPLNLDGSRLILLGAELGPAAIRVVATSIKGDILESNQAVLRSREPDPACHQLVEMVSALSARVTREGAQLLGIGVGLHGLVDKRSGMLEFAPNIGWRNVDVGKRLGAELGRSGLGNVPVYYHNEADVAALSETSSANAPSPIRWCT